MSRFVFGHTLQTKLSRKSSGLARKPIHNDCKLRPHHRGPMVRNDDKLFTLNFNPAQHCSTYYETGDVVRNERKLRASSYASFPQLYHDHPQGPTLQFDELYLPSGFADARTSQQYTTIADKHSHTRHFLSYNVTCTKGACSPHMLQILTSTARPY